MLKIPGVRLRPQHPQNRRVSLVAPSKRCPWPPDIVGVHICTLRHLRGVARQVLAREGVARARDAKRPNRNCFGRGANRFRLAMFDLVGRDTQIAACGG